MELNFNLRGRGKLDVQAELLGFLVGATIFLSILRFILSKSGVVFDYYYVPLIAFLLMMLVCFKDFKRMFHG